MCWRLHPEDLLVVMDEATKFGKFIGEKTGHPWRPLKDFQLLGVRVVADEAAPRLPDSAAGFTTSEKSDG
jgi:hypothetical protein